MRPSETGSEVLKVSRDGLQGGFRAAFHVHVLKRRQGEAEVSVASSRGQTGGLRRPDKPTSGRSLWVLTESTPK